MDALASVCGTKFDKQILLPGGGGFDVDGMVMHCFWTKKNAAIFSGVFCTVFTSYYLVTYYFFVFVSACIDLDHVVLADEQWHLNDMAICFDCIFYLGFFQNVA